MTKESISTKETKRENEYAGEIIRIIELLKTRLPEQEATLLAQDIEKIVREQDENIDKILSDPRVIKRYDTEKYDGISLQTRDGFTYRESVLHSGLYILQSLNKESVFISAFNEGRHYDGKFKPEYLLNWLKESVGYTKKRLEVLEKTGDISLVGASGVKTKYFNAAEEKSDKEPDPKPN